MASMAPDIRPVTAAWPFRARLSVVAPSVRHVTSPHVDALRRYAFDHHGVVTGSAAAALGVRPTDLHDLVGAGELVLVAGDVYRMQDVVTPLTEYAEAVALAGPGAVLADDTVLALHDLAQIDPARIRVAVPSPLPPGIQLPPAVEVVVRELAPAHVTEVECIPTMTVAAAMQACGSRMMAGRLLLAVDRAWEEGLVDDATALALRTEFVPPTVSLEELMGELERSRDPGAVLRSADWLSLTEVAARRGEPTSARSVRGRTHDDGKGRSSFWRPPTGSRWSCRRSSSPPTVTHGRSCGRCCSCCSTPRALTVGRCGPG